ncbi:MAG: radical SAM protein [Bacteroidales bacterium]|jgi:uncharacterized protein|nr:radical SAM protein [Bacteroidales bacterium]
MIHFFKFQSKSGKNYVWDSRSNEIIQISEILYDILDSENEVDFKNTVKKFTTKHSETSIQTAVSALYHLKQRGFLCDQNILKETPKIKGVLLKGKEYLFEDFLNTHSRMLTLELTQRCNLNCIYCVYGNFYPRFRNHSEKTMTWDIATRAIKFHCDMLNSNCHIGFYGGEPLIEFNLLRELVLFTEDYCKQNGRKKPSFSLTTNGTLLNDKIIHFFVKHNVRVLISIDADRVSHNTYRIFRNSGMGSFDTIEKNMERFVSLYPDYNGRAVAITITSGHDPICSNTWMSKFIEFYSIGVVTYVRSITTNDRMCSQCDSEKCKHEVNDLSYPNNLAFHNWTNDDIQRFNNAYVEFIEDLYKSPVDSYKRWPIFYELFKDRYRDLFRRQIFAQRVEKISCGCLPGAVRLFCNVDGDYYPCERVEQSDSLRIGNVWTGIDFTKVKWMINLFLENVNCHQCIGEYICAICPTSMMENKDTGEIDYRFIKEECQQKINNLKKQLAYYVSINEENPNIFEQIYSEESIASHDDWLPEIQLVLDSVSVNCHCCQLTNP